MNGRLIKNNRSALGAYGIQSCMGGQADGWTDARMAVNMNGNKSMEHKQATNEGEGTLVECTCILGGFSDTLVNFVFLYVTKPTHRVYGHEKHHFKSIFTFNPSCAITSIPRSGFTNRLRQVCRFTPHRL